MAMQEIIRDLSEDFIKFPREPKIAREFNHLIADVAVFWYNREAMYDWRDIVNSKDTDGIFENSAYYLDMYNQMILLGYANVFRPYAEGTMSDIIDVAMADVLGYAHQVLVLASRV